MIVIDPGHIYDIRNLDGGGIQRLQFVKRIGEGYPGNNTTHPGMISQFPIRAIIGRTRYVQRQVWCLENVLVIFLLRLTLWLFEFRAARRHGLWYLKSLNYSEFAKTCSTCGHTLCRH